MRHRLLCILAMLLIHGAAWAAVYQGSSFRFSQPDGSTFPVRLWGDEFSIHAESPDGWTVIKGADRWWYFAQPAVGGGITASALRVGAGNPATLRTHRHLRQSKTQRTASVELQRQRLHRNTRGLVDSPLLRQVRAARGAALPAAAPGGPQPAPPGAATIGTRTGVTLMIRFPDQMAEATFNQSQIDAFCNADNYTAFGNNGSVKEYFFDNSLGRLTYTNSVINYYTAIHDRNYYTDPAFDRAVELITEALNAADAAGFDFRTCDANHDGIIDGVNAFYAGPIVNDWAEGLWPHMSSMTWNSNDGVQTAFYQITDMGNSLALGTFCHENGHMLCDFPDLYDYDYDSTGGAGIFCLMNSGGDGVNPVRVCGYLALAAGWRDAIDLQSSPIGQRTIASESSNIFRYQKAGSLTEYFLIENRYTGSDSGRDARLPSSGLAIWHCDTLGDRDDQRYMKNTFHENYECTLVQADDLRDLESNINDGDAKDLWFLGNSAIGYDNRFEDGDGLNPLANDARWWNGSASGLILSEISAPGALMTFTYGETTLGLNAASYTVAEGNSGITQAAISVIRTGSLFGSASLNWTATDGTATVADLDHPGASGTVTWPSGVGGLKSFLVPINGDTRSELDESILLNVATSTPGARIGLAAATLTVTNDDGSVPNGGSLELTTYAATVTEGTGASPSLVEVQVQRRGGSSGVVFVPWSVVAGTASAGVDYTATGGTLIWADGDAANKTISIPIIADALPEIDETLRLVLGTATGGAFAPTPNTCTISILNDDYQISLTTDRLRLSEPYAGTMNMPIPVRRLGTVHGNLSVDYHIVADGTAIPGTDFIMIAAGTLTWDASSITDPSIMLPVVADGETEVAETLSVVLDNPVGFTLGAPSSAIVEIADVVSPSHVSGTNSGTASDNNSQGGACGAGTTALLIGFGLAGLGVIPLRRRRR